MSERRPATGTPGEPASWIRTVEGAEPDIARRPFLYEDTGYAPAAAEPSATGAPASPPATAPPPADRVNGPLIQRPVWTWEIPLYFWLGGIASGASFVAFACDLAGDGRSARTARAVAMGALAPCPPLLVSDLGRPERFHHMLKRFNPRSPMSMGAWALSLFGVLGGGAVAADLLGRPAAARALGAANAVVGGYVGSYTGVLLSTTAVPLWSRSRLFLGPIFVSTAVATGAAAVRLALGTGADRRTLAALGRVETVAIACELALSRLNERRLGEVARPLREDRSGRLFQAAQACVAAALALQATRRRRAAGAFILAAGLAYRYGWVEAGKRSAEDDEVVARTARRR